MGDLGGAPALRADGTPPVEGKGRTAEGLTPKAILDPVILRFAVLTYLVVLPVGQLFAIPFNGTTATGSDVFLALVLLAGLIEVGRMSGPYFAGRVESLPLLPGRMPLVFGITASRMSGGRSGPTSSVPSSLPRSCSWFFVWACHGVC